MKVCDGSLYHEIATIYREVPVDYSLEELKFSSTITKELTNLYNELEFYSFLKKMYVAEQTHRFLPH